MRGGARPTQTQKTASCAAQYHCWHPLLTAAQKRVADIRNSASPMAEY